MKCLRFQFQIYQYKITQWRKYHVHVILLINIIIIQIKHLFINLLFEFDFITNVQEVLCFQYFINIWNFKSYKFEKLGFAILQQCGCYIIRGTVSTYKMFSLEKNFQCFNIANIDLSITSANFGNYLMYTLTISQLWRSP